MKIGKKHFLVYESIFNRKVTVFINYSGKEFDKWCDKNKFQYDPDDDEDDLIGFSTYMSIDGKPTEWIIVCKNFQWTLTNQGTLIHEIVHTIIKIWANNNMKVNLDTQEFFAHEVSELYEDICAKIIKLKKIKKK